MFDYQNLKRCHIFIYGCFYGGRNDFLLWHPMKSVSLRKSSATKVIEHIQKSTLELFVYRKYYDMTR